MMVEIKPEDEILVRRSLEEGFFASAEEVVHHALHAEAFERWIAANKQSISEHIDEGWAQLDRGERLTEEECMAHMAEMKARWRKENGRE
jgi:Arc/MetJ-type ribon-helix-helix transcriptional regulator